MQSPLFVLSSENLENELRQKLRENIRELKSQNLSKENLKLVMQDAHKTFGLCQTELVQLIETYCNESEQFFRQKSVPKSKRRRCDGEETESATAEERFGFFNYTGFGFSAIVLGRMYDDGTNSLEIIPNHKIRERMDEVEQKYEEFDKGGKKLEQRILAWADYFHLDWVRKCDLATLSICTLVADRYPL